MSKGIYTGEEVLNDQGVDYAFPGYCSLCHTQVADLDEKGRVVKLRSEFDEVQVLLSDQSLMRCPVCKTCKDNFKPGDSGKLMESEIRGWAHFSSLKAGSEVLTKSSLEIMIRTDSPWTAKEMESITKPDKTKLGPIVKAVLEKSKQKEEK